MHDPHRFVLYAVFNLATRVSRPTPPPAPLRNSNSVGTPSRAQPRRAHEDTHRRKRTGRDTSGRSGVQHNSVGTHTTRTRPRRARVGPEPDGSTCATHE
eukprot:7176474-Prymnesium_polylepis.2